MLCNEQLCYTKHKVIEAASIFGNISSAGYPLTWNQQNYIIDYSDELNEPENTQILKILNCVL